MRRKREYKDYLTDIIQAMEMVEKFTKGLDFQDFKSDEKTIFAVLRALEVIGEAVKKIPKSVKSEYEQMPWRKMAGMRDKLIHEYFGVNIKVVWKTIKEDLPKVRPLIKEVLRKIDENFSKKEGSKQI